MKVLTALTALTVLTAPTLTAPTLTAQGTPMSALGTFDVKVIPQPPDDSAAGPFGRLFLDKQFHGDLEGTSKGQMLGSINEQVKGSGAYVALELVTGTLNGRKGSFILQHNGTMQGGNSTLNVAVVPDSGTDELTGLAGKMTIIIAGRDHSYEFEYTIDASPSP